MWTIDEQCLSYKHYNWGEVHDFYMHEMKGCWTLALSHPLAWAHFITVIAFWFPCWVRQRVQHEALVPHFLSQSWRVATHLESAWQVAHSLGHFYSTHCWGSATFSANLKAEARMMRTTKMMVFLICRYFINYWMVLILKIKKASFISKIVYLTLVKLTL